jgi:glycosyltransferase involved in cell wall biosynthesis
LASRAQRWAICLEQTLGHRAHGINLERQLARTKNHVDVFRVEYPAATRIPVPWALRGSLDARRQVKRARSDYDVAFFHTQTIALMAPSVGARRFVVSVDATPAQMDRGGAWYGHNRGSRAAESLKSRCYRRTFNRAAAIVAWSEWASESLVTEYGVERDKVLVAHPGAPSAFFSVARDGRSDRPTVLFVGGDFRRKGGEHLLRAFEAVSDRADLVVVSEEEIPVRHGSSGFKQLQGVRPGTEELLRAYAAADIFCLPTLGDCTPVVLGEAMAAGLPVITTRVGSAAETVPDGQCGLLVDPGDPGQLHAALERLIGDAAMREDMGSAARNLARERFDANRNGARILRLLETVGA